MSEQNSQAPQGSQEPQVQWQQFPAGALSSQIFGAAFQDPAVTHQLSDESYCRALLRFEGALALVQGQLSVIPSKAAEQILEVCQSLVVDRVVLSAGVQRDGMPMIALVALLREAVGPDAAPYVHLGATSQDAMDTATILQLRPVVQHLRRSVVDVAKQLVVWAELHRDTVMVARTHAQQAVPTSFGLKAAGWLAPLLRHLERLDQLEPRLWQLQLSGAAGTLASLGQTASAVRTNLARELELSLGDMSWHAQRDTLVELGGWLTLVCGSLAKFAQDTILLSQSEVAEVLEAAPGARGGSSCMPQKNNPMRCEQVVAAARTAAAHLSALHGAMVHEHERATHGWQVEWLNLPPLVALTAGALRNAQAVLQDLQVRPEQMLSNLRRNHDLALAERLTVALGAVIPRPEAQTLVKRSALQAMQQARPLVAVLQEVLQEHAAGTQSAEPALAALKWNELADPKQALGQSTAFVDAVVLRARKLLAEELVS